MASDVDKLAIFGGQPLFRTPRPFGQLWMPDVDAYLRLVRSSYDADNLTDGGENAIALEHELAVYHGVRNCVSVANAGLGLIMLLELFANGRSGEVLMPAFSYRGLPHIARWAGQMPRFCEADRVTHTLDLAYLASAIDERTTSILAVCNFNSAGDVDGLCRIARDRSVPIIFDSVEALGSTYGGRRLGPNGCAEVFSTHATKLLNGFEGGYITTDDDGLAERLRWQREYAPKDRAPAERGNVLGMNARFNELHAAMARLSLAAIDTVIAGNKARYDAYRVICDGLPGLELLPVIDGGGERSNYRMVIVGIGPEWSLTRDETVSVLRAEGAAIMAYWHPALHRSSHAPPGMPIPSLPVAESLAEQYLHLPVGELVSLDDIEQIGERLRILSQSGDAIARKLRSAVPV